MWDAVKAVKETDGNVSEAARILGISWDKKKIPKKSNIKEAIIELCDTCPDTSHEADAVLAVLVLFSDLIPNEKQPTP